MNDEARFPKFVSGIQTIMDVSSLSTALACGYKYKLSRLEGWRLKSPKASTSWGTMVHLGAQVYDSEHFYGKSKDEACLDAIAAMLGGSRGFQSDDTARTIQSAIRAIVWRAEDRERSNVRVAAMPDGSPALEQRFEVPFIEGHRFSGIIDKLADVDGSLYIVDTKTTKSALTDYFFDLYSIDNQLFAYLWAARFVLGLPVSGFIIDAIQTGVNFTRTGFRTFRKTDAELIQWKKDIDFELETIALMHQRGHFPQRRTSCNMYNGCEFKEVCKLPQDHHKTWLETFYTQSLHKDLQNEQSENIPAA